MRRLRSDRSLFHHAVGALLLLAIWTGQWIGLEHRVRHAGLESANLHVLASEGTNHGTDGNGHGSTHSCLLFDSAALGAGIPGAWAPDSCEPAARDWLLAWPLLSWQATFHAHFSSRAPPLN